jgi:DNA-binding IclR family transcriptional regulator
MQVRRGESVIDKTAAQSQTLSRGLRVLEVLAERGQPMSIAALSESVGLHRSITYRFLRTLEQHSLVRRDEAGLVRLSLGLAALARGIEADLQAVAQGELAALADQLAMTAFLVVLSGSECVTLVSVAPSRTAAAVVYRPGARHSLAVGAPGIAIQAAMNAEQWRAVADVQPRDSLDEVRRAGYATSHDEVIPGLRSVAVPLTVPGHPVQVCAVAVVYVSTKLSENELACAVGETARAMASRLH